MGHCLSDILALPPKKNAPKNNAYLCCPSCSWAPVVAIQGLSENAVAERAANGDKAAMAKEVDISLFLAAKLRVVGKGVVDIISDAAMGRRGQNKAPA